jgi:hypothetical protein
MPKFEIGEITLDKLKSMSDEDLYFLHRKYKDMISEAFRKHWDTQKLEIECCYLQRELELRRRFSTSLNKSQ